MKTDSSFQENMSQNTEYQLASEERLYAKTLSNSACTRSDTEVVKHEEVMP